MNHQIPLLQFPLIFWSESTFFGHDALSDLYDLETMRILMVAQGVVSLYLFHIGFYSATN